MYIEEYVYSIYNRYKYTYIRYIVISIIFFIDNYAETKFSVSKYIGTFIEMSLNIKY